VDRTLRIPKNTNTS